MFFRGSALLYIPIKINVTIDCGDREDKIPVGTDQCLTCQVCEISGIQVQLLLWF